jgi:hypothetical protein
MGVATGMGNKTPQAPCFLLFSALSGVFQNAILNAMNTPFSPAPDIAPCTRPLGASLSMAWVRALAVSPSAR